MRALTGLLCAVALLSKEHGADAGAEVEGADNAAAIAKMQAQVMSLASMTGAICEAMCKQVQAFPACAACPGFALPPPPPAAMTFDQLLEWMQNTGNKYRDELNSLKKKAAGLPEV